MTDEIWVVRAGERARFAEEFVRGGYLAIGFEDVAPDDLSKVDPGALRARGDTPSRRNAVSQLHAFAHRIEDGDLVIVPSTPGDGQEYWVGRVVGNYEHTDAPTAAGPHRRAVQWLGRFARELLSQSGKNTLGAIQTVFRPAAVDAELRALLTALQPIPDSPAAPGQRGLSVPLTNAGATTNEAPLPVAVISPSTPVASVQLDIAMDGGGRAKIRCDFPALMMEQTPRDVDPGSDWRGVPGVYVLTGTELEQSSARTGRERTLTMTSIVKPWAYVGLSEDFLGRLSSHRQAKPEWRRALLIRSGGQPFSSDDIKYLERRVHALIQETGEVVLGQTEPRGNLSAQPRNPGLLDACAGAVLAVMRLTGTLI